MSHRAGVVAGSLIRDLRKQIITQAEKSDVPTTSIEHSQISSSESYIYKYSTSPKRGLIVQLSKVLLFTLA